MTEGEATAQFRAAIEREDPGEAIAAARAKSYVGLGDSLDLVRLLARKGDPRFDPFANRWINRWLVEKGASVGEVSVATAAMGTLAVNPDSEAAVAALRSVVRPD